MPETDESPFDVGIDLAKGARAVLPLDIQDDVVWQTLYHWPESGAEEDEN